MAHPQKLDALTRILEVENFDGMIIFVRTKHATEELAERLRARGFSAAAINGDVVQAQRERTIDQLRKGKLDILVATDVAARGLDVERISHVINHDIPTDTESYVHRIGRTGRAGRSGQAISFVTPRENYLLRAIEKANRTTLEQMSLPTVEDVNAFRVAKFTEAITQALGDAQLGIFRELVQSYEQEHDVPAADIAAAIAVLAQDGEPLFLEEMPEPRTPERRERRELGERPRPVADLGRQAPPGRAAPDRRRARQRGRPEARRLRPHRHQAELLARRAAARPLPGDAGQARRHPHLRDPDRPAARQGPGPAVRAAQAVQRRSASGASPGSKKPRHKKG